MRLFGGFWQDYSLPQLFLAVHILPVQLVSRKKWLQNLRHVVSTATPSPLELLLCSLWL